MYAFSYDLPKALPGDYESPRGDVAIRYDLRAYVDVPFRVDIEHTERLTVYEPYEATDESASITDNKSFPMSADSQLVVKATLDKSAYKLGETVHHRARHREPVESLSRRHRGRAPPDRVPR